MTSVTLLPQPNAHFLFLLLPPHFSLAISRTYVSLGRTFFCLFSFSLLHETLDFKYSKNGKGPTSPL